jgi:hypothetical protein
LCLIKCIEATVPEISRFFGIVIRMFYNDHAPPHFHAEYGEHEALIEIESLAVYAGYLPNRALGLVREWAGLHREELRQDWTLARTGQVPSRIAPLE